MQFLNEFKFSTLVDVFARCTPGVDGMQETA